MAVGDVQFNPSTLKVSYTSATSKAQVREPPPSGCGLCSGSTPEQIEITLADIVPCDSICILLSGEYYNYSFDADVNTTWTLNRTSGCDWRVLSSGSFRVIKSIYSDFGCTNFLRNEYVFYYVIVDKINATSIRIRIITTDFLYIFQRVSWTVTSKCLEASNITNGLATCVSNMAGRLGTAAVVEL